MTYKGYSARPEYSAEDGAFFGRLLGINDLVNFESAMQRAWRKSFIRQWTAIWRSALK